MMRILCTSTSIWWNKVTEGTLLIYDSNHIFIFSPRAGYAPYVPYEGADRAPITVGLAEAMEEAMRAARAAPRGLWVFDPNYDPTSARRYRLQRSAARAAARAQAP